MEKLNYYIAQGRNIIKKADLLGKTNNDYGRGFYCTQELSIAVEKKNVMVSKSIYFLSKDSNILNLDESTIF